MRLAKHRKIRHDNEMKTINDLHNVYFSEQLITNDAISCIKQYPKSIVVCDHHTLSLGQRIAKHTSEPMLVIPAGEQSKSRSIKAWLEDQWLQKQLCREDVVIACGGGMVLDLVGFSAATYLRGIDCLYWPTSLLAMVDASLGRKTAINVHGIKNAIGTFQEPKGIFLATDCLKSLPWRELREGFIECIKHLLLTQPNEIISLLNQSQPLEHWLAQDMPSNIMQQLCIKHHFVAQDRYDHGRRQYLNLGHTLGHAIESITGCSHGTAVAIGLHFMAYASHHILGFPAEHLQQIAQTLHRLKIKSPHHLQAERLLTQCLSDKKRTQQGLRWILLKQIGEPCTVTLSADESLQLITDWIEHHAYSLS